MENNRPRSTVKTTVLSSRSAAAFDDVSLYVREWLSAQAAEWEIAGVSFAQSISQGTNEVARMIVQQEVNSLAFAFSHVDERARDTEWRIFGSVTATDEIAKIDLEVEVEGIFRPVVPPLGMPAFMPRAVSSPGLIDVWPLSLSPRAITTENAATFVDFVRSMERRLPIIAFSAPLSTTPEDLRRIGNRVAGAAHIVTIDIPASFIISELIGPKFSVYRGAVRVYHPRLSDNPFEIPLFFPDSISQMNNDGRMNGPFGARRFADVLVRTTLDRTVWPAPREEQPAAPVVTTQSFTAIAAITVPQEVVDEEPVAATQSVLEALEAIEPKPREAEIQSAELTPPEVAELRVRIAALEAENAKLSTSQEYYFNEYVRQAQAAEELKNRVSGTIDDDIAGASEQDLAILRNLTEALSAVRGVIVRTAAAEAEAQSLRDRLAELEQQVARQNYAIEALRRRSTTEPSTDEPVPPNDYRAVEDLQRYLRQRHGERIILHDNAVRLCAMACIRIRLTLSLASISSAPFITK